MIDNLFANQIVLQNIGNKLWEMADEEDRENKIKKGLCPECGTKLPDPIYEQRQGGYSEAVTYCSSCGITFTN